MIQPLEAAFEYRHAVERSLSELNEQCGLPGISNVKQCVRKIASRLQKGNLIGAVLIRNQSNVRSLRRMSSNRATSAVLLDSNV